MNSFGNVHAHSIESVYALLWREHLWCFRRWGKLESTLEYVAQLRTSLRLLSYADEAAVRIVNLASNSLQSIDSKRRLNGAYPLLRDNLLRWVTRSSDPADTTRTGKFSIRPDNDLKRALFLPGLILCASALLRQATTKVAPAGKVKCL